MFSDLGREFTLDAITKLFIFLSVFSNIRYASKLKFQVTEIV
jgi:hypothetical protein